MPAPRVPVTGRSSRLRVDDGDLGLIGNPEDRLPDRGQGARLAQPCRPTSSRLSSRRAGSTTGFSALSPRAKGILSGSTAPSVSRWASMMSCSATRSGNRASVSTLQRRWLRLSPRRCPRVAIRSPSDPSISGTPINSMTGLVTPKPGRSRSCRPHDGAPSAAHLGFVRIAQPELNSRVGHREHRLLLTDQPAAGAGHHVHTP